jgi:threonylcarbamoyladenosine tRNA methylthiotransferase MtaB
VASLAVTYLHVFPFSPRPGTEAARRPRLPVGEVQARAKVMRLLGQAKKTAFFQGQVGKVREVLVEGPGPERGSLRGLSDNYLRVALPGPPEWRNRRVPVLLREVQGEMMVGEAIRPPE